MTKNTEWVGQYLSDKLDHFPSIVKVIIQRKEAMVVESLRALRKGRMGMTVGVDAFGMPTEVFPFVDSMGNNNLNMFRVMENREFFKANNLWLSAKQAEFHRLESGELSYFDWLKGLIIENHTEIRFNEAMGLSYIIVETKTKDFYRKLNQEMSSRETVTILFDMERNEVQQQEIKEKKEEIQKTKVTENELDLI